MPDEVPSTAARFVAVVAAVFAGALLLVALLDPDLLHPVTSRIGEVAYDVTSAVSRAMRTWGAPAR